MLSAPADAALADALQRGLRRRVLLRDATEPFAGDFGGVVRRRPLAVAVVGSEAELAHALRVARRAGVPVTLRGAGHSCGGQSLDTGVVVVNDARGADCRVLDDGRVEVSGRARWRDALRALAPYGRTLPVLTSSLETSVGGTLAVGGYGVASVAAGAQVDHVERLRLVLPDGGAVWCSRDEHPELFRHSLGGLGQLGAIERAVIRTVRPAALRYEQRQHGSLGELAIAAAGLAAGAREFYAEHVGGQTRSYVGRAAPDARPPKPGEPSPPAPPAPPGVYHVWCDFALGLDALVPFARLVERVFGSDPLRAAVQRIYLLGLRGAGAVSALDLRGFTAEPSVFGVGVHCAGDAGGAWLAGVQAGQRELLDGCIALGGRPYLCGAHALDEPRRRAVYGDAYLRLRELRAELDPSGLFNRRALGATAATETAAAVT